MSDSSALHTLSSPVCLRVFSCRGYDEFGSPGSGRLWHAQQRATSRTPGPCLRRCAVAAAAAARRVSTRRDVRSLRAFATWSAHTAEQGWRAVGASAWRVCCRARRRPRRRACHRHARNPDLSTWPLRAPHGRRCGPHTPQNLHLWWDCAAAVRCALRHTASPARRTGAPLSWGCDARGWHAETRGLASTARHVRLLGRA